jgi:hypothetical protein
MFLDIRKKNYQFFLFSSYTPKDIFRTLMLFLVQQLFKYGYKFNNCNYQSIKSVISLHLYNQILSI